MKVSHVPREGNGLADGLAKWGAGVSEVFKGNYMPFE